MKKLFVSLATTVFILSVSIASAGNNDLIDDLLISIEESCDDIGIEKERMIKLVNALTAEIISKSRRGEKVRLDGFGTFYSERTMENHFPVRNVVHFKAHNADWIQDEQSQVPYMLTNR